MVLGNMDIGLNTANLTGVVLVFLLAIVNMFGVRLGSLIQNVFTSAKALSLAALIVLTFTVDEQLRPGLRILARARPVLAQCGLEFSSSCAGGHRGTACAGESGGHFAVVQVDRCSADSWNNITFTAGEVKNPSGTSHYRWCWAQGLC